MYKHIVAFPNNGMLFSNKKRPLYLITYNPHGKYHKLLLYNLCIWNYKKKTNVLWQNTDE